MLADSHALTDPFARQSVLLKRASLSHGLRSVDRSALHGLRGRAAR